jgi:carbon monoxide dehydrogenase subunit G
MKNRKYLILISLLIFILQATNSNAAPLKISETQPLSFGLVAVGSGGSISTNGSSSGDVQMFGEYQNGTFQIVGKANREVNIAFLGETNLQQKGYKIRDVDFQVLEGDIIRLGSNGIANITILGSVNVNSGQEHGWYTESYNVKASYKK